MPALTEPEDVTTAEQLGASCSRVEFHSRTARKRTRNCGSEEKTIEKTQCVVQREYTDKGAQSVVQRENLFLRLCIFFVALH